MTAALHWLGSANGLVALAVGVLTLVFLLVKAGSRINAAMRRQQSIDELLDRELRDTGNGSLKGAISRIEPQLWQAKVDVAQVRADVAKVQGTLDRHIYDASLHVQLHDHDPDAHKHDDDSPDAGPAGPKG